MRAALPRFAGISGAIGAPAHDLPARPACLPQKAFDKTCAGMRQPVSIWQQRARLENL
jgi:hypothetical protein